MADPDYSDVDVTVTVRVFGSGTAAEAAVALAAWEGALSLPGERPAKIISARPAGGGDDG